MTSYHVYSNAGSGAVDYATIIATTSALTWTSSALAFPGVWKFGVRAYDTASGLEEKNIDALVAITLDAGGVDISLMPDPPLALSAHANGPTRIIVDWQHAVLDPSHKPTGFHIYAGTSGVPNYLTPVATVPWANGLHFYTASISALSGGVAYTFAVRAFNVTSEETNTMTVSATAVIAVTATVTGLTGSAIA